MNVGVQENQRGRLVQYAPWMARDYMSNQGPSTAIVVLLIGFLTVSPAMIGMRSNPAAVPPDILKGLLRAMMAPLVFIGVLFATNGIVANDRKLGYYRFLFAKPIEPPAYYAANFLVNGAGFLVVSLALTALWSFVVGAVSPSGVLLVVVIMYVAYGGLGFLLSAAWRFDWLSLVTVLFVANVGWSVWGNAQGLRHWLLYLLPPVHRATEVYAMAVPGAGPATPWRAIAWLLGYGVTCFVLGLVVVRKRPLGTS